MKRRWTDKEVELLKEMAHKGYQDKEIAEKLSRTKKSISSKRYKENIEQHKFNENIFNNWSKKNSWLLGLITADGTFNRNNVTLYNTDKEMLKEFKKILGTQNKISEHITNRLGNKKVWRTGVSSENFIKDLKALNAHGDKDQRNPFPLVPDIYKWSFIKGLFDGDGNIYKGIISIAGRMPMIKFVYYWICQQIDKKPNKIYQSSNSDKTYYFQISPGDAIEVVDYIRLNAEGTYNSKKIKEVLDYYENP